MPKFSVREIRYYNSGFHHPYIFYKMTTFGYFVYITFGLVIFWALVASFAWILSCYQIVHNLIWFGEWITHCEYINLVNWFIRIAEWEQIYYLGQYMRGIYFGGFGLFKTNCQQCKYRGTYQGQWCYMQDKHPGEYCVYFKAGNWWIIKSMKNILEFI